MSILFALLIFSFIFFGQNIIKIEDESIGIDFNNKNSIKESKGNEKYFIINALLILYLTFGKKDIYARVFALLMIFPFNKATLDFENLYGGSRDDSQTGKGRRYRYEASAG